ncbi:pyridoxamine 5'-phosphate oxidase family protein [Sandarakinorhabdus oryzae]|uniref:pyridoxamine 5'-phosphate oxidase family protein n=1 Tax=Sandarakinorhabdus oryzae TaxID=2675220 RepID=UPI0012E21EFF|nr:pyridoxamine 5'-phosphate oxidase family protein [Sandarakinorhabdus oryzae]
MAQTFLRTVFTDTTRQLQAADGSRDAYAKMEGDSAAGVDEMGEREADFIAARDSFYMASVTADGWPYIQHRGGPAGFLKWLPGNMLGFADYSGNRQFVSMANIADDNRVALFLMDYPNRRRLKLVGRARVVTAVDDPALVSSLMPNGYRALAERAFLIDVVGFDWNCPQHITPRFTEAEIAAAVAPLNTELATLRAENERLRAILKDKTA